MVRFEKPKCYATFWNSLNPKYEKNLLFYIGGGGGGVMGALTSNPGLQHFQSSKTSSQSRQIHDNGEKLGVIGLGPYCFPAILSPISIYIYNMEAIR